MLHVIDLWLLSSLPENEKVFFIKSLNPSCQYCTVMFGKSLLPSLFLLFNVTFLLVTQVKHIIGPEEVWLTTEELSQIVHMLLIHTMNAPKLASSRSGRPRPPELKRVQVNFILSSLLYGILWISYVK